MRIVIIPTYLTPSNYMMQCTLCLKSVLKELKMTILPAGSNFPYECNICGTYEVDNAAEGAILPKSIVQNERYKLSGLSRYLMEHKANPLVVRIADMENLLLNPLVPDDDDIERRAMLLLEAIKMRTKKFGDYIEFNDQYDYPLSFSQDRHEFRSLIGLLEERNVVRLPYGNSASSQVIVVITGDGWSMLKRTYASKQAFIAIWFDDSMGGTIAAIEGAVVATGHTSMCIKEKHYPEKVIDKALGEIRKSKFIIVDLTATRPSVFFEAGFASGLGLDIVYVCHEQGKKKLEEFYSKHYKVYFYKDPDDLKFQLIDAIAGRGLSLT